MRRLSFVLALVAVLAPATARAGVDVFPAAGSRVASARTQISFRGATAAQLRRVTVTGVRTGRHAFKVRAHSDGQGASLLLRRPLRSGELVTVRAPGLALTGAASGVMRFRVARFAPQARLYFREGRGSSRGLQRFHSDRSVRPPSLVIRRGSGAASSDDFFLAPKGGPGQNGTMIVNGLGQLVWFHPVPDPLAPFDFRTQEYRGRPVLTWWQGRVFLPGEGAGEAMIYDSSYRRIARVRAGNGYSADLHEFQLTPNGTALLDAYQAVRWHGRVVLDGIVQEIDVRTGLVEFEWHSLDHVATAESFFPPVAHQPWDYIHVNSVEPEPDGSLLVSGRNTRTVYDVDRHSAQIAWRLGGKRSDFKMGPGASFVAQHDARRLSDGTISIYDNGSPPVTRRKARGIVLSLDMTAKTATLMRALGHTPGFGSGNSGSFQALGDGGFLVDWGSHSWLTQYDASGTPVLDAQLEPDADDSYRDYRLPWSARPAAPPALAASSGRSATVVYASWNGATDVASWRVLAGDDRDSLQPVATAVRTGFETSIGFAGRPRFVRVQALGAAGEALGSSRTIRPKRRAL